MYINGCIHMWFQIIWHTNNEAITKTILVFFLILEKYFIAPHVSYCMSQSDNYLRVIVFGNLYIYCTSAYRSFRCREHSFRQKLFCAFKNGPTYSVCGRQVHSGFRLRRASWNFLHLLASIFHLLGSIREHRLHAVSNIWCGFIVMLPYV